jgi:hypothetical protein
MRLRQAQPREICRLDEPAENGVHASGYTFVMSHFEKLLHDVETHGFHVILVPEDDEGPGFGYTVGLHETLSQPEVLASHYDAFVGQALRFYSGASFPLLQCVWPDKNGRFPWAKEAAAGFVAAQPLLDTPWPWD